MVTKSPATTAKDKKLPAAKAKAPATVPAAKAAPKANTLKAKLAEHKKGKANDESKVLDVGSLIGASEQVSTESNLRARIKELENSKFDMIKKELAKFSKKYSKVKDQKNCDKCKNEQEFK